LKNYFEFRRSGFELRRSVKVDTKVAMELIENNDFGPRRSVEYDH